MTIVNFIKFKNTLEVNFKIDLKSIESQVTFSCTVRREKDRMVANPNTGQLMYLSKENRP